PALELPRQFTPRRRNALVGQNVRVEDAQRLAAPPFNSVKIRDDASHVLALAVPIRRLADDAAPVPNAWQPNHEPLFTSLLIEAPQRQRLLFAFGYRHGNAYIG